MLGAATLIAISMIPFLTSIHGKLISSLLISPPIGFAPWVALRQITLISVISVNTIPAGLLTGIHSPFFTLWENLGDESTLGLTPVIATLTFLVGLVQWLLWRGRFARA